MKRFNLSEDFNWFIEILITQTKHFSHLTIAIINLKYSLKQENDFLIQRKLIKRKLNNKREKIVEAWFAANEITIDIIINIFERVL